MKKIKITQFIGRQLSRLKAGQTYYMLGINTITALGVLKMALPNIDFWVFAALFPVVLFGAFLIGYFMDIWNIGSMDYNKTVEINYRYLNISDLKTVEFQILMTKTMGEWFKSLQENRPINTDILEKRYQEYLKKWNPPKDKS